MHFGYYQQGRTLTAAMALTTGLLPPMARTRRLGRSGIIRSCRFLALGAVETLGQVADRCLKRCHLCRQGCFALDRPRVLRLPVIRLPRALDIGLGLQALSAEYGTCAIFRLIAHPGLCNVCCFRAAVLG